MRCPYRSSHTYEARNGCQSGYLEGRGWNNVEKRSTSTSCPQYQVPLCPNGTLVSNGTDANGCSLGYRCATSSSNSCAADVSASQSYASNLACTQIAATLRCPYDSSYTYVGNGCHKSFLQSRGWLSAGQGNSCAEDVSLAQGYAQGRICGQGGRELVCPRDMSYKVQTLNTCTEGYLKDLGWH